MQHLRRRNANLDQNFNHRLTPSNYLVCEGVILDTLESVTNHPLRSSDLTKQFGVDGVVEDIQNNFPAVEDEAQIKALVEKLLLGHPRRRGPHPSLFATPWAETFKEVADCPEDRASAFAIWRNWTSFWQDVKFEGYLGAFDKFRKENANFRVCGYELRSFFPQWKPGIEPYPVEVEEEIAFKKWSQDAPKNCKGYATRGTFAG
jgi:hypothetical protein